MVKDSNQKRTGRFVTDLELTVKIKLSGPAGVDVRRTGKRIKELCEKHDITVKKIQTELHISSFQSVYAWFAGKTLPSLDNMYQLSSLLDVSMEEIIVGTPLDMDFSLDMENMAPQKQSGRNITRRPRGQNVTYYLNYYIQSGCE